MTISVQNPINEYTGNGSAKTFNYTFYITTAADLKVYLNGVVQSSGFTVTGADNQSGGTVVFVTAPGSGVRVRLQRRVALERSTDYQEAAAIPTATLDRDFDRAWMAIQDARVETLTLDLSSNYDATNHRIINVVDPINAQDAATKHWVETGMTSVLVLATAQGTIATTKAAEAAASAIAAASSASSASTSASTATTKASQASTSETNAANSSTSAGNSAIAAANSATAVVGAVADATTQANAAAASASSATTSKNNAAASEAAAAASAAAALISKNSASASATTASDAAAEAQDILDEFLGSGGGGGAVSSVNTRTGAVVLTKTDVGLANADNTSDANKPVSTAQQTALDLKVNSSLIGVANGVASLDSSGFVPSAQLPSYVDDVLEYANLAAFPGTGATGKIYVTLDTNKTYRWSGSAYVEISASPGSTDAVTEGSTNLYYTDARVRATVLTGLSTATNAAITSTDTVLTAAGKLQKQTTDHLANTSNPHSTTKAQVGLGNVDNTADTAKPVSTAQQTALDLKAPLASPSFTGTVAFSGATVTGLTKSSVGLSLVDNTADSAKPVSTAQQTALDLKATIASPTFTGTPAAPTATGGTNTTQIATTAFVTTAVSTKANTASPTFTGTVTIPSGASIAGFAPLASPTFTGTPVAPTAAVGTNTTQIATTEFVQAATTALVVKSQSAAYTLVLADAGALIFHPAADTTTRTWTIPANSSVAFAVGTCVTFDNDVGAGAITIAITTDTMVMVGAAGSTGSRTLAAGGRATAVKVSSTRWRIDGALLT